VLRDGVEHPRTAWPKDCLYAPEKIGLGGNRCAGDHKRPLAAQAVDLGCELRHGTFTEDNTLLGKKRERAL
jgi:hypothetical protein